MAVKLDDGVWWLEIEALGFWKINTYLVNDSDTVTLVDCGLPWNTDQLERQIEAAGYTPSEIDKVLITHYDLDHFGGLLRLDELTPSEVYAGNPDAGYLSGEEKPNLLNHKGAFHRAIAPFLPKIEAVTVEDGDEVGGFRIHETPGHNPGHIAYTHDRMDVGFVGDLVWESNEELTPPVWADSYDMTELHASIKRLSDHVDSFNWICMGHGTPLQNGSRELRKLAEKL